MLTSSIAIVIGPTPPGTGVIAAATSAAASKSTSPPRPSSVRLTPTSITTAPGLTASAPSSRGTPTAATSTSARRQTSARSRVREWQTVTVALAASSRRATGTPTSFERPTTTASAPSSSTPSWRSSSITPAGVQGTRPGVPWASRPALTGVRPSTSLAGSIAATTRSGSICSGSGSCTRMPSTSSSRLERGDQLQQLRLARLGAEAVVDRARSRPPRRPVLAAHVDLRGGVVADDHRGQDRRAPASALEGDHLGRTRSRTAAATALPSMIRAAIPTASGSARSRPSACARSRRRRSARRPPRRARPR